MLNAINTKVLVGILAALSTIAALMVHQQVVTANATEAAQQATDAINHAMVAVEHLQAGMIAQQQEEAAFQANVASAKKHSNAYPGHESKTWQHYIP